MRSAPAGLYGSAAGSTAASIGVSAGRKRTSASCLCMNSIGFFTKNPSRVILCGRDFVGLP